MFTFDIIIPTHLRSDLLQASLAELARTERPEQLKKIWVIENGGKTGAVDVCCSFAGTLPVEYLYEESGGASGARNIGMKSSSADFYLFFDDDVRPQNGALMAYAKAFEKHGDRAFFGGPLIADYEEVPSHWLSEFLPPSAKGFSLGNHEILVDKPEFLGGNFAVSRRAVSESGAFEGPCAMGKNGGGLGEETRLQFRLLARGYKGVYVPDAGVFHFVPRVRCNQDFVVHRSWRTGYGEGQMMAMASNNQRNFLGYPRWYWRTLASAVLKLLLVSANPMAGKAKRFRHFLRVKELIGWVRGYQSQING